MNHDSGTRSAARGVLGGRGRGVFGRRRGGAHGGPRCRLSRWVVQIPAEGAWGVAAQELELEGLGARGLGDPFPGVGSPRGFGLVAVLRASLQEATRLSNRLEGPLGVGGEAAG